MVNNESTIRKIILVRIRLSKAHSGKKQERKDKREFIPKPNSAPLEPTNQNWSFYGHFHAKESSFIPNSVIKKNFVFVSLSDSLRKEKFEMLSFLSPKKLLKTPDFH